MDSRRTIGFMRGPFVRPHSGRKSPGNSEK
jgi:hypothetical protein